MAALPPVCVETIVRTDGVEEYHAWCTCSRHVCRTDDRLEVARRMGLHLLNASGEHRDLLAQRRELAAQPSDEDLDGFRL